MPQNTRVLDDVLKGLMNRYVERVKNVSVLIKEMKQTGIIDDVSDIDNDHIAFRTLGVDNLGISSLEKIFLHLGYKKMNSLDFPEKKLRAHWYSPPTEKHPRIFISELKVEQLSETSQAIIKSYTDSIASDPVDELDLDDSDKIDMFLHCPLWSVPDLGHFKILSEESEYAAWVIYNRYYLNHFTISVHNLPQGYNDINSFTEWVEGLGIKLNNAGGKVKVSQDELLLQSSTVAELVNAIFACGEKLMIPGSYIEFAERRVRSEYSTIDPSDIKRHHRRDGFESQNADKIFESTYTHQIQN